MRQNIAPLTRILLRYGVGAALGSAAVGKQLAADPDVVILASLAVGAVVEAAYVYAKRKGWAT